MVRYWGKGEDGPEPYEDIGDQTPPGPGRPAHELSGPAAVAAPQQASLMFSVEPVDAAIYLDDQFIGIADELNGAAEGIPVRPGKHTIIASRPGFKSRTLEIDVAAGDSERVDVSLSK